MGILEIKEDEYRQREGVIERKHKTYIFGSRKKTKKDESSI